MLSVPIVPEGIAYPATRLRVGDVVRIVHNPWSEFGSDPQPGTLATVTRVDRAYDTKIGWQVAVGISWKGAKAGGHSGSTRQGSLRWFPLRIPADKTVMTIEGVSRAPRRPSLLDFIPRGTTYTRVT